MGFLVSMYSRHLEATYQAVQSTMLLEAAPKGNHTPTIQGSRSTRQTKKTKRLPGRSRTFLLVAFVLERRKLFTKEYFCEPAVLWVACIGRRSRSLRRVADVTFYKCPKNGESESFKSKPKLLVRCPDHILYRTNIRKRLSVFIIRGLSTNSRVAAVVRATHGPHTRQE